MNDCERKIQGLEEKLARQSTMLAQALKEKNDALQTASGARRQLDFFREENVRLQAELKQWKPAPQKFQLGEVVTSSAQIIPETARSFFKISMARVNSERVWEYWEGRTWLSELVLRSLTRQERGQ